MQTHATEIATECRLHVRTRRGVERLTVGTQRLMNYRRRTAAGEAIGAGMIRGARERCWLAAATRANSAASARFARYRVCQWRSIAPHAWRLLGWAIL